MYCDVYKWTILKRTSPEVKCLHPTSSRREMCTSSVSNVIYHKFLHGAAFYTLSRKRGWSGGAMVLGKLPVPGRPTNFDYCRARAYCACTRCGWG